MIFVNETIQFDTVEARAFSHVELHIQITSVMLIWTTTYTTLLMLESIHTPFAPEISEVVVKRCTIVCIYPMMVSINSKIGLHNSRIEFPHSH